MKFLIAVFGVIVFGFAVTTQAQKVSVVDHWKTEAECMAASGAPFYYPSIISKKKLAKSELVMGHPTGGCFEMDLPDRFGGRGFVRIEAGRKFVYDSVSGALLRLAECNNDVYKVAPFAPPKGTAGIQGIQGLRGPDGLQGIPGPQGPKGDKGDPGAPTVPALYRPSERGGFCHSKKCRFTVAAIGGAAAGYAAWYYWPCPPVRQ